MNVEQALNKIRTASTPGSRNGLWPGRVEAIDDPLFMNRVRVRVFAIHGSPQQTPAEALPWAEVTDLGGGSPDTGSAGRLYVIGATVWVSFEMGDEDFPVVVGGRRGGKPVHDEKNPGEFNTLGGTDPSTIETPWIPAQDNELPKDVFGGSANEDRHPTRTVWHKSFKGHTIVVEDRDDAEFLQIIDRVGQVIEMNCPVSADANANNAAARGVHNAADNTQLSQDILSTGRAFIRLRDVAGQEIILDGSSSNEGIRIVSRNRLGTAQQTITLSSAKGKESIKIQDKQGDTLLFDPNSSTPIVLADSTGNKIEFDVEKATIRTTQSNEDALISGRSSSTITGGRTATIGGDDSTRVLQNKFLDVMNDFAISVAGLTSAILTGPVSIAIANGQMTGIPGLNALSVQIAQGGILLQTLSGVVNIATVGGLLNLLSGGMTSVTAPAIALGSPAAVDGVAMNSLVIAALSTMIGIFNAHVHPTGVGPSGPTVTPMTPPSNVGSLITKTM